MRNPLLASEVRELLQEGRTQDLVSVLQEMHPTAAAAILSALEDGEVATTLGLLPRERRMEHGIVSAEGRADLVFAESAAAQKILARRARQHGE